MTAIIYVNKAGRQIAETIWKEIEGSEIIPYGHFSEELFRDSNSIVFIGAMGICVRAIAPYINDKYSDPAVVCVDSSGKNAISVLSGHVGGGNELCRRIAACLGATPVITTQSDNAGLWALDTMSIDYGWILDCSREELNRAIYTLVNGKPIGLLLDVKDRGTGILESTLPHNIHLISNENDTNGIDLVIAVTFRMIDCNVPVIYYRPPVLNLGIGCRFQCNPEGVKEHVYSVMRENGLSPASLKSVASIDLKKDEKMIGDFGRESNIKRVVFYTPEQLKDIEVPNPSQKVREVTGVWGVAESSAILSSGGGPLLLKKQKGKLNEDSDFTFAVALDRDAIRGGHIEIVGAGPGDPELVSVRGKRFLQQADLILYAGSLVPKELTYYAKDGATVRSSADLCLEEQFSLMKEFYDRGLLVVRLHTGDPCIYGAIQEQMAFFDKYGMSYHITPGISSFQAAAAALRSQFTIPEKVQTIILTRGEGRTPMPEKEQLHRLAASQSTMCIYLSAGIVDDVQRELLMAYPPDTPVAACYKLTWKEERIYRGVLKDLARIVHDNKLTLTTLLVVGDAIDNREGLSKLYHKDFKHLFRK